LRSAFLIASRSELAGLPEALITLQVEAQGRDYAARYPHADEQIVIRDGRAVGRLWVDRRDDHWRLIDIVLLPAVRGAGLATRLLTGLVADASRAGVPVRLTVARDNDARRLYARLGFATVAEEGLWVLMERPI